MTLRVTKASLTGAIIESPLFGCNRRQEDGVFKTELKAHLLFNDCHYFANLILGTRLWP